MKDFFKRNFYKILGYAGVIPFALFLAGFIANQGNPIFGNLMLVMQMVYGAIIISFLSGTHWPDAVRDKKIIKMIFSVLPTIFLIPIIFWGMSHSPIQALLMMVVLFWFIFALDRGYFYYRNDGVTMPRGYILFRFVSTVLVTIILSVTYWLAS